MDISRLVELSKLPRSEADRKKFAEDSIKRIKEREREFERQSKMLEPGPGFYERQYNI